MINDSSQHHNNTAITLTTGQCFTLICSFCPADKWSTRQCLVRQINKLLYKLRMIYES